MHGVTTMTTPPVPQESPVSAAPAPPPDPRTRVRRIPELARQDRRDLDAVLDAGVVAHLAVVDDGLPYAMPMGYVRDGDQLLLHGSTGSRLLRLLADGAPTCATVTLFDGLVVARSAFESSMHYRCAMVFGRCTPAEDPVEALERFTDGLLPGRTGEVRASSRKELAATSVLCLPIESWSVKVSDDDPEDPEEDQAQDVWAGVIPVESRYAAPRPAGDLRAGIPVPPSVTRLQARSAHPSGPHGAGP